MVRYFSLLLFLISLNVFGQDNCPDFTIVNQKSGMHFGPLVKYPERGVIVFGGLYGGLPEIGGGSSLRLNMVKYKISLGWDVRTEDPEFFKKSEATSVLPHTNVYGVTAGKYWMLMDSKYILDMGVGVGQTYDDNVLNDSPLFGYGVLSYQFYGKTLLTGSVHVMDFETTPRFAIGVAIMDW